MRILITPLILQPKTDASYYLTKCLISALLQNRHAVAVSTSAENGFRGISLYQDTPCGSLKRNRSRKHSYEDWLCTQGAGSAKYLIRDDQNIQKIIHHFHPDLIITIGRIAAVSASRVCGVRCWAIVSSAMYRNVDVAEEMHGFNELLSHDDLEQAFTLKEIFDTCEQRICFSPAALQPFPASAHVTRIGIQGIQPLPASDEKRICIYPGKNGISSGRLRKILLDACRDLPYAVHVWYPDCRIGNTENIRFLPAFREDLLNGCSAVVHEGNTWMSNACAARGIPQIVIADHTYLRSWNGQRIERCGNGIRLQEKELTGELLRSQMQALLNNEDIRRKAESLMEQTLELGDLRKLYPLLKTGKIKRSF